MGCGKSTVGRKMAEMFRWPLIDTDALIEEQEGTTISEIFAVKGEQYFRDLETECLKCLLEQNNSIESIISVGGGLPVKEENRKLLKLLGEVIYLKASPETIYERLKSDTTRPLLQTDNPKQKIIDMLKNREEKYQSAAHRVIEVDNKSITEIIQEINRNDGSHSLVTGE